jgi:hypothetical protein
VGYSLREDRWRFTEVRKRHCLGPLFDVKSIILPRQARDEHRKSTPKSTVFFLQWIKWDTATLRPLWNSTAEFNGLELYDHAGDFGASMDAATDKVNLAHEPQWASVVAKLRAALRAQFSGDHEPPQQPVPLQL